jgi:hypothetical protein
MWLMSGDASYVPHRGHRDLMGDLVRQYLPVIALRKFSGLAVALDFAAVRRCRRLWPWRQKESPSTWRQRNK